LSRGFLDALFFKTNAGLCCLGSFQIGGGDSVGLLAVLVFDFGSNFISDNVTGIGLGFEDLLDSVLNAL